jgi:hypothetical protein
LGGFGWLGREIHAIEAQDLWMRESVLRACRSDVRRKKAPPFMACMGIWSHWNVRGPDDSGLGDEGDVGGTSGRPPNIGNFPPPDDPLV